MSHEETSSVEVASLLDEEIDDEEEEQEEVTKSPRHDKPPVARKAPTHQVRRRKETDEEEALSHDSPPASEPNPSKAYYYMQHPTRPDNLEFDMNQPWERSLLRQLQQRNKITGQGGPKQELMYLGHTESRDFALEWDDETTMSLETDASSTLPAKAQFVHRSLLYRYPQPRVAGYTSTTPVQYPPPPQTTIDLMDSSVHSEITMMTTKEERDDDHGATLPPPALGRARRKYSEAPDMGLPDYNPACCGFTGMFDYVLPPPPVKLRHRHSARPLTQIDEEMERMLESPEDAFRAAAI